MRDPRTRAGARPVRPRDAATLVLVRDARLRPRVLMGRRHGGHDFMPGKFVFPGGRLDVADHRIQPLRDLRPEVAVRAGRGASPAGPARAERARALALAAVRETFEEAGLRVGRPVERAPRTRSASWYGFFAAGVAPCLDGLEFVARAITPPDSPRRYDARFFLADAAEIAGDPDALRAGDGELGELGWIPVDDARRLDLPAVTRLVIDEVAKRIAARPAERAALPAPFWRFRGERPLLELL